MELKVKNVNYCATITEIANIVVLPNCDNVVAAIVAGNQVIVQKDAKIGDKGVFFPVECKLSPKFLASNNLYQDSTLNNDKTKKGYINEKGRLKCVAFRGNKSEGLFLGMNCLSSFASEKEIETLKVGDEFDELKGEMICEKYVAQIQTQSSKNSNGKKNSNKEPRVSRMIESQFQFHIDTAQLNKNMHRINPDDIISVTDKFHGTSAIFANILTVKPLTWCEKIAKKFGVSVDDKTYSLIYSSRGVVKNKYFPTKGEFVDHNDVWTFHANKLKGLIPNGFTVYGEIVGWTSGGKCIQKGFHYGCAEGTSQLYVYRVTQVNDAGQFIELTWGQIKNFCNKYGLKHTPEFYYGRAKDLFQEITVDENWHSNVLEKMKNSFNLEQKCEYNNKKVPAEGVVVRVDDLFDCKSFKLKSYAFRQMESKEMDSGENDIETQESIQE